MTREACIEAVAIGLRRAGGAGRLSLALGWVAAFLAFAGAAAAQNSTGEFARAQQIYQEQIKGIRDDAARKAEACDLACLAALDQLQKEYQGAGDLNGVLAVQAERNRLRPETNAHVVSVSLVPQRVQALRASHGDTRKKIDADRATQVQSLVQKYLTHLANLKKELTKQGRIDEALTVESEIAVVKGSDLKEAQAVLGGPAPKPPAEEVRPAAESLEDKLKKIAIPGMRYEANYPFNPLNGIIDYLYPNGIGLKVETTRLSMSSVYYDSMGKPRYSGRPDMNAPRMPYRSVELGPTTALEALRSFCDTFGLGYKFEKDTVVIVNPDDPQVVWGRPNVAAEELAAEFVADGPKAVEKYRGKDVRITGTVVNTSKSVSGNLLVTLAGPRAVRVEFPRDADAEQEANLQREVQRYREQLAMAERYAGQDGGPRPVRRIGEGPSTPVAPPQPGMMRLVFSAVVQYDSQSAGGISFEGARDMWWQRTYGP